MVLLSLFGNKIKMCLAIDSYLTIEENEKDKNMFNLV